MWREFSFLFPLFITLQNEIRWKILNINHIWILVYINKLFKQSDNALMPPKNQTFYFVGKRGGGVLGSIIDRDVLLKKFLPQLAWSGWKPHFYFRYLTNIFKNWTNRMSAGGTLTFKIWINREKVWRDRFGGPNESWRGKVLPFN